MLPRALLSLVLLVAGVLHLVRPELFDPAIPFEPKYAINIIAGGIEIILGFGLWSKRLRDYAAQATALWFLILIPIHVYVSIMHIPMFGVDEPFLLWMRTGFQAALFFWALSLQDHGWIISQRWSDVLFLHYEVDAKKLQEKVPYPIDLFEGKAVVSIVPFVMGHIRFPFLPTVPGLSRLLELNLRTYVTVAGRPAVYFFTLDANHLPGVLIARTFFRLPYRWRRLHLNHKESYLFECESLSLRASVDQVIATSDFDRWTTERYALVTKFAGRDLLGVVEHRPWSLKRAQVLQIEDKFSQEFISLNKFLGASYAQKLDVRFRPFKMM
jgi:uncharacterized protein YqjF (DUF2071 family)